MTNHHQQIQIDTWCLEKRENLEQLLQNRDWKETVAQIAALCIDSIENGQKILVCGNGGSAAQSQHFAAEFVVRLRQWRRALPMVALTTDTSILTAYSNDAGFEGVFARQVEALGQKGDVLLALTTSGKSPNLSLALNTAREYSLKTAAFSGPRAAEIDPLCDIVLHTPGNDTAQVQEGHLIALHLVCMLVEEYYLKSG